MTSVEEIRASLQRVMDPELGRNIVELGMVRDIHLSDGRAEVTLALTTLACPLKGKIINDVESALRALDSGLEVQVKPVEMSDEERSKIFQRAPERGTADAFNKIHRVIAVASGKGGVGKSSVAALLAVALRKQGQRVGLLDADVTGPSIPRMFGLQVQPKVTPFGLMPVVSSGGVKVMSANLLLSHEDIPIVWRGPLISGLIRQFWGDVLWEELDTLIIDLPPGTSDATLTVMQSIPVNAVLLVTSPQDLAGMVVRKAAQMARGLSIPVIGLIENMSYVQCPDCGRRIDVFGPSRAEATAQTLGIPLLGRIALDAGLAFSADEGVIESYPADAFTPIAEAVSAAVAAVAPVHPTAAASDAK